MNKLTIAGLYILFAVIIALVAAYFIQNMIQGLSTFDVKTETSDIKDKAERAYRSARGQPDVVNAEIIEWVEKAAPDAMTFSYDNLDARFAQSADYFNDNGLKLFMGGLRRSRIIDMITLNKQSVAAILKAKPVIESQGFVDDRYQWMVSAPLVVTYSQGSKRYATGTLVNVVIVQSDDLKHKDGIAIDKWSAAPR